MKCLINFVWLLFVLRYAHASDPMAPPLGRLPDEVVPTHYSLQLELDPERDRFSGAVEISATLKQAQRHIWMHGLGLDVSSVSVRSAEGDLIGSYAQVDDSGVAKLSFPLDLPAGTVQIRIAYSAKYGTRLEGLYKVIDAGQPYLFTQFESIFARQMFPSFDEPGFKTPFDVSIRIPKTQRVIFNSPIAAVEEQGDWQNVRFATTKKLPTYLLAVVVGEIDIIDFAPIPPNAVRDRPIPLRGVATKGKGKLMQYALANTAATVEKLEQYFATPYPFEKLDLIAVPDFGSGAMENAGAITYREQLMLFTDDAPIAQKVAYTGTHAHELAHQWFGNLVTPTWWDDIWLNEAFATWMGLKIGGATQPRFNFQNRVQTGAQYAMELDSLPSARKIRNEVNDKNEIVGAFDAITYRKGGGVLMMFERYMGEEKFREGVRLYMRRHAFGNASAKDFLHALSEAAGDPSLLPAFESFLTQNGVPRLALEHQCVGDKVTVKLRQSRYQPLGVSTVDSAIGKQNWQLPVCLRYPEKAPFKMVSTCVMLTQAEQEFALQSKSCPPWVLPNAAGSGYLRFALSDPQWRALLPDLGRLSSAELLALHDALNAQLYAGEIDAERYLRYAEKIIAVGDSDTIVASLTTLRVVFEKLLPTNAKQQARAKKLLRKQVNLLGLDPGAQDKEAPAARAELRARVLEFAALVARDKNLRRQLSERGSAYLGLEGSAASKPVSPDVRELALAISVQERGMPAIKALQAKLESSADAVFRAQALKALGRVEDEKLAEQIREYALAPVLRSNEVMSILSTQAAQPTTSDALWRWTQANFSRIVSRLSEKSQAQVFGLAESRCDEQGLAQVTDFFADKAGSMTNGRRALANTEQRIRRCVALVQAAR